MTKSAILTLFAILVSYPLRLNAADWFALTDSSKQQQEVSSYDPTKDLINQLKVDRIQTSMRCVGVAGLSFKEKLIVSQPIRVRNKLFKIIFFSNPQKSVFSITNVHDQVFIKDISIEDLETKFNELVSE